MLIVRPDFARRIDLPGAGPCPRPVDIDASRADLEHLVSLRVYRFAQGVTIDGEAEDDEVFVVLMRGAADVAVREGDGREQDFVLRADGRRAIYLPPDAAYRLGAVDDCDIAYARCRPIADPPPARVFAAVSGRFEVAGHATGMALSLGSLPVGAGEQRERFVHVRGDGFVVIAGERLGDWDSVILNEGDAADIDVQGGTVDLLIVSATAR